MQDLFNSLKGLITERSRKSKLKTAFDHAIVSQINTHLGETVAQLFQCCVKELDFDVDDIPSDMETVTLTEYGV